MLALRVYNAVQASSEPKTVVTIPLNLYRYLPRRGNSRPSALAIGNFDGVHRGHQALLQRLHAHAQVQGLQPGVMMFHPHPRAWFARRNQRPELIPTQISGLRDKILTLRDFGAEQVVLLRFDQTLAEMPAERFISDVLVRGLDTRWLIVGQDFRFGARRTGDLGMLERAGKQYGFEVQTLEDVTDSHAHRISSSEVRTALAVGNLARASALLGRPYRISGHVIHGRKLGRTLGFPTLNLRAPVPCAARSGIYVVRVHGLASQVLPGVASLGVRPTVTEHGDLLLETHVLNRRVDAYGKLIGVELLAYLRDEEKFSDLSQLGAAMTEDMRRAHEYFTLHGL